LGFAPDEAGAGLRQDFEQADQERRWAREYLERRPGREKRTAEAACEGRWGLGLNDEATFAMMGLRAATVVRTGAQGIRFKIRAAAGECPSPRVDLLAEAPTGQRFVWQWPAGEPLTATWCEVRLPFAALTPTSQSPAPFALWSPALGLLRFSNAAGARVYLDEVSLY
ncbi:MAG: hypothetical protein HUU35_08045, partial [Armatimonadetes bacterium]|nr:hypothetical protein [Armatimonadota bacterium]